MVSIQIGGNVYFYPRSPCGERRKSNKLAGLKLVFLSTLSLRRATPSVTPAPSRRKNFYPRSPCGERQPSNTLRLTNLMISIHALLAESDTLICPVIAEMTISIHALLAESDNQHQRKQKDETQQFLSTLSLRRATKMHALIFANLVLFLSTLSLRRATSITIITTYTVSFLSTLSLRRATLAGPSGPAFLFNFYPRSPCGERLILHMAHLMGLLFLSTLSLRRATTDVSYLSIDNSISIHALLAESDQVCICVVYYTCKFLSTLSLRRATTDMSKRLIEL